jgi:hypothetical protein
MSRTMISWVAFASLIAGCYSLQTKAQEETYTGVLQTQGTGAGGTQIRFNFVITKWSTQDEIKQLGGILKDKGQTVLLDEMNKLNAGRIYKRGETGNEIAVAEKWQNGDDTVITMISARRMSLFETNAKGISTKYPFAFLQVTLNSKGEGSGKLVEAAAITYDKEKDTYRLDPYGQGARLVSNVKPVK